MKDVRRKVEASPSAEDFRKDARAAVTHNPDGSWVATVRGRENMRRAAEMQEGVRRADVEMGERIRSGRPTERVVNERGRIERVPAHMADRIARKRGLHARTGAMLTGGWLPNAKDREREAEE